MVVLRAPVFSTSLSERSWGVAACLLTFGLHPHYRRQAGGVGHRALEIDCTMESVLVVVELPLVEYPTSFFQAEE